MIKVAPADLRIGQVLCGDDGAPFGVVLEAPSFTDTGWKVAIADLPSGPFDVRTFSNDHRYMRTNGLACIEGWSTYADAVACRERSNARRTHEEREVWRQYSAVYHAGTAHPVYASKLPHFTDVEFPAGTDAPVYDGK